MKGWYELQRRLLDAGETDYRAYAQVQRIIFCERFLPCPLAANSDFARECFLVF